MELSSNKYIKIPNSSYEMFVYNKYNVNHIEKNFTFLNDYRLNKVHNELFTTYWKSRHNQIVTVSGLLNRAKNDMIVFLLHYTMDDTAEEILEKMKNYFNINL